MPDELASAGYFTSEEVRWLSGWLDLLAPFALAPLPKRFRHGDLQTTNVMVHPDPSTYLALIDWGACGWGDAAHDFAGIPLRAVPFMLAGYREVAPLTEDDTAEARILWRHLQMALYLLGRPRSRDGRGPSARRRCCSRSRASSSVRRAGRGRICTEAREPRPQRATRISQPVTRYLCDFGQACSHHNLAQCLL
jgi:Ser/Thr protein kinase RdoA (MazF antagonist)